MLKFKRWEVKGAYNIWASNDAGTILKAKCVTSLILTTYMELKKGEGATFSLKPATLTNRWINNKLHNRKETRNTKRRKSSPFSENPDSTSSNNSVKMQRLFTSSLSLQAEYLGAGPSSPKWRPSHGIVGASTIQKPWSYLMYYGFLNYITLLFFCPWSFVVVRLL